MSQEKKPIILLIEADQSLRRLISLGLQQRGLYVIEASSLASIPAFDIQQLTLLVLDIDSNTGTNWSLLERVQSHPHFAPLPVVALAWDNRPSDHPSDKIIAVAPTHITYLPKPFDARILFKAISRQLAAQAAKEAAIEARAEAALLATYKSHTAPSIWPVITAAGLLLIVIGLLLQMVIAMVGFLVVIAALLIWTLGAKPETEKISTVLLHPGVNT